MRITLNGRGNKTKASNIVDAYRYGFNGKLKDNEWSGIGNSLNYGFRMEDTRIGRFRSIDPAAKKFPMLTPYQYGSDNPIANIDIDGKEGYNQAVGYMEKAAGFTTATERQMCDDVQKGIQTAANVSYDVVKIGTGVVMIAGSGGAALPVVLGAVAVGGGATKLYFDAKGDNERSESVPTTVSGTVLVTANVVVGKKIFSQQFISTVEFGEGVATMDLKNLTNPNILKQISEGGNLLTLTVDAATVPGNVKKLLEKNNFGGSGSFAAPTDDATHVKKPVIDKKSSIKVSSTKSSDAKSNEKKSSSTTASSQTTIGQ